MWLSAALATVILITYLFIHPVNTKKSEDMDRPFSLSDGLPARTYMANFAKRHGYPMQRHETITEDGYILTLYLMPQGDQNKKGWVSKTILLTHGLLTSSDCWFMNHPGARLPFKLYDEGYNVMLANFRGTTHSSLHANLSIHSAEFWDFSWDEIGRFDLKAMIDYTLGLMRQEKLFLIGHSMGTTTGFVLLSEMPEYNAKLYRFIALAPSAFMSHSPSPLRWLWSPFPTIQDIQRELVRTATTRGTFPPNYPILEKWRRRCAAAIVGKIPQNSSVLDLIVATDCRRRLSTTGGIREEKIGKESFDALLSIPFEMASVKTILHYMQGLFGNHFRQYDFGPVTNFRRYGSRTPPNYDLTRVTCPITLFWGSSDDFATKEDVEMLVQKLTNSSDLKVHKIEKEPWNHFAYILSKDSAIYLNPLILDSLQLSSVDKDHT